MAPQVDHLEKENALKILYATESNKVVGIAPFRKTRKSLKAKFGYNIIEPLTTGNTDYTGIILAEQETRCLSKFLTYLFNQEDWDLLYFPDLPQTSPTLDAIKRIHTSLPRFEIKKGIICPYISVPDSKEKLLANLSRKFQRELNRRLRKLEKEQGIVELKPYYELGSLEQAMKILFRIHQKRWALDGDSGSFNRPEARKIAVQQANLFSERGWFRLYFLTVNNRPVAAEINLEYGRKRYASYCGFDPDYSKYSVGSLLMLKVLEECIEKGVSEYDLMQGAEPYKFCWTNRFRQNMNVRFVNKKLSANIVCVVLRALHMSKFCIRNIFPKLM
ncbi:MAG: GNAT family N-acetyltransferase [Candidatus Bathyarchaeota archaeon]|nr:MAG: GNAT family N-acetyltransferase [Candidatus Bathyarchaeota archaeon]